MTIVLNCTEEDGNRADNCLRSWEPSMEQTLQRILIISDETDFIRLAASGAERLGLATRILRHTLDFEYVMQHWAPGCIAVQMAMAGHQDIYVLGFLERMGFPGSILLTGGVPEKALQDAAGVARVHGLNVTSVLSTPCSRADVESALKLLAHMERAA
jgi:CheY-like chemotaxis protein